MLDRLANPDAIAPATASRTEGGWRALDDRGREPEAAPLLYHVNLGAPVWSPGATLALDARRTLPRDADAVEPWDRALDVVPGARDRVLEHEAAADGDGWCEATVDSPPTGVRLTPRREAARLPRAHQWVHPAPGIAVLGRVADRAAGRLRLLEPGAERVTRLQLRVAPR